MPTWEQGGVHHNPNDDNIDIRDRIEMKNSNLSFETRVIINSLPYSFLLLWFYLDLLLPSSSFLLLFYFIFLNQTKRAIYRQQRLWFH